jgi:hypothetical protein
MILKTKIDWLQNKELSDSEKELLQAKKEFLGDDYIDDDEKQYEEIEKNAIIDTDSDKLYIEIDDEKVCMVRLLGGDYYPTEDGALQRIEERLYFMSTLDEIYNTLTNNNN